MLDFGYEAFFRFLRYTFCGVECETSSLLRYIAVALTGEFYVRKFMNVRH